MASDEATLYHPHYSTFTWIK